jgi:hypothetical protein
MFSLQKTKYWLLAWLISRIIANGDS